MTATIDHQTKLQGIPPSEMVHQLIRSCCKAQQGFRSAAKAVGDTPLKRLFEIYAQQRTRFADELREYLPAFDDSYGASAAKGDGLYFQDAQDAHGTLSQHDFLRECLKLEDKTLSLYKDALAHGALPTRAHFLISSQLSLMQRVHDRMRLMLETPLSTSRPLLRAEPVSA